MDLTVAAWILILLSSIIFWIKQRRERLSVFKRNGIPGPEPSFWTGNFKAFMEKREEAVAEFVEQYGKICGFFLGMKPFVIVTDPELIKIIQVKEFGNFTNRDSILKDSGMPQPILMKTVGALRDEEWRKHRAFLSPLFSSRKLKMIMPIINEASDIFMENLKKVSGEECVNLVKMVKNLLLDIMAKAALGIDMGVQYETNSRILQSAKIFLSVDISDGLPKMSLCLPELEPIPTKLRNVKDSLKYLLGLPSVKQLLENVRQVVNYRKKTSQRREDILQALMDEKTEVQKILSVRDEELIASYENKETVKPIESGENRSNTSSQFSLSEDSVVANAGILLVAGTDTSSMTISRAAFFLSKNEEIQDKVREELKNVIGEKENIDYDDLAKLSYLDQVVSETLRLHPVGSLVTTRTTRQPFHYNGMTIPEGVTVIIPPSCLQRNPEYWSDPEKFDPERFSPENKAKISPSVYQPFGSGPRNCVGMRLGQILVKHALARLIRSYKISNCGKNAQVNHAMFIDQLEELMVKLEPVTQ